MEKNLAELRSSWSSRPQPPWVWSEQPLWSLTNVCVLEKTDHCYSGSLLMPAVNTCNKFHLKVHDMCKLKSPLMSARVHGAEQHQGQSLAHLSLHRGQPETGRASSRAVLSQL